MNYKQYKITCERAGSISSKLAEQWTMLLQNISHPSFIHDVHWFRAYLNNNPQEAKTCHIITLSYQSQTIAIFPLQYITNKRFGLNLRSWRIFWPNDMGINDFILGQPPELHNYIMVLLWFLSTDREHPWDLLELQNVAENARIASALKVHRITKKVSSYHHDSKYLVCEQTYEDTIANLSSKFKRNNRRKLRNLEKIGKISTRYYNTRNELQQAFQHFLDIEAANWKGQEKTALQHDEQQRCFYQELLNEYAETGKCVIHTLDLDDIPIAVQYALISGNTLFLLKIGYNAKYHAMSPGGILLNETLKRFSGDPVIKNISFVTGAKWNDDWAPKICPVHNHYIFNHTFKGLAAWTAEIVKSKLRIIKHKEQPNE